MLLRLTRGVLLALVFLQGCATPPLTKRLIDLPPPDLPIAAEIEEVPFYPQELFQCGPASLAAVLNYRGIKTNPEELRSEIYVPDREGSFPLEVVAAARSRGLLVYPLAKSLEAVFREIAAGNPVLVLQNLSIPIYPLWHYAVVIGYDLKESQVILRSGTTERLVASMGTFENTWERSKFWAIAVMPPNKLPSTVEEFPYVKAASELEAVKQLQAAEQAYTLALDEWPNNAVALMGLGNISYRSGDLIKAKDTFNRFIRVYPNDPNGWNNYSYALSGLGCHNSAVDAAQCALYLSPENPNILDTLKEITAARDTTKINKGIDCPQIRCAN